MSLEFSLGELKGHLAVGDRDVEWVNGVNGLTMGVAMDVLRNSPDVGYIRDEVQSVLQRAYDLIQDVDSLRACSVSDRILSRMMDVDDYIRGLG